MHPLLAAGFANACPADRAGAARRVRPPRRRHVRARRPGRARRRRRHPARRRRPTRPRSSRLGALDGDRRAGELLAAAADEHGVLVAEVDGGSRPRSRSTAASPSPTRSAPARCTRSCSRCAPASSAATRRAAAAARSACCTRARRNVRAVLPPGPSAPPRPPDLGVAGAADGAAAPQRRPPRRAVHAAHRVDRRADGRRLRPRRRAHGIRRARRRARSPARARASSSRSSGRARSCVLDGPAHLRQRKLMLPPFHGDRMRAHRELIAALAAAEVERWPARRAVRHPRAHAGAHARRDHARRLRRRAARAALRDPPHARHDDVAAADAVLLADRQRPRLPARARRGRGAADRGDPRAAARRRRRRDPRRADRRRAPSDDELRDQLVTLLAAGHETTAGALAWALERLARHPRGARSGCATDEPRLRRRGRQGGAAHAPRAHDRRAQARRAVRVAGWELPAGVHVAPCIYLTHRRADLYADPTAFRPERFLGDGAPDSYAWIPFGGGVRRCVGAAFAAMEMTEVLRAVAARVSSAPTGRPASACAGARSR